MKRSSCGCRSAAVLTLSFVAASTVLCGASTSAVGAELPPIVYVQRSGPGRLPPLGDGRRPGLRPTGTWSRLMVREADGTERVLLANRTDPASLPIDFADPDVSYDGTRVLFAGFSEREDAWRIFEVGADGKGLRQLTHSDRELDLSRYGDAAASLRDYDDLDPCYLPDGRICFSSTRFPGIAVKRGRTTNLYVARGDGSDLHRITHERYGADTPAVDPKSGAIVYSRWWHSVPQLSRRPDDLVNAGNKAPPPPPASPPPGGYYSAGRPPPPPPPPEASPALSALSEEDFAGLNSWFLAAVRPDGTELTMFAGFHFDRQATQAWRPTFLPDGRVAALFLTEAPFFALSSAKGLRLFEPGMNLPRELGGPQTFEAETVGDYVYASASALPDGTLVVSAAHRDAPRDFDLYLQAAGRRPPLRLLGAAGKAEVEPVPLVARDVPPILEDRYEGRVDEEMPMTVDEAFERGGSFKFIVENIYANAPVNAPLPNAPPLGKELSIEFYTAPQRQGNGPADQPLLVTTRRLPPSGRVEVELPAGVPLFEVLRTRDGKLARGRDGQVFHVGGQNFGHEGTVARCVGCHTGHSMQSVPPDPSWTNLAPGAEIEVRGSRQPPAGDDKADWFHPDNLVDRVTKRNTGEWRSLARSTSEPPAFGLSWSEELEAREVVLYPPGGGPEEETEATADTKDGTESDGTESETEETEEATEAATDDAPDLQTSEHEVVIKLFEEEAASSGLPIFETSVSAHLVAEGTRIPIDEAVTFKSLWVEFPNVKSVAIGEVEVIARSTDDPFHFFVRGDADCDQTLNMTDPLQTLAILFFGAAVCCEGAADVDANNVLTINDTLVLLNHLFLNGSPPAAPFPLCGIGRSALTCAEESCE